jgi:hypothetical protein
LRSELWLVAMFLACAFPAGAVELRYPEGTLRGFPAVRDQKGHLVADGTLTQWIEQGKLRVLATFRFRDGRRVQEKAVLAQTPELAQLRWEWEERRGDEVLRSFSVDLETGRALASKRKDNGEVEHWEENLEDARKTGRAFAGLGFMYAIKNLTDELDRGEQVQLTAVAFTPKPRTVTVTVRRDLVGELTMAGRKLPAERFQIHPDVPSVAKIFVKAPDLYLWFYRPSPPAFLRADIPLAEPSDPVVRIEVLPTASLRRQARSARR